MSDGAQLGKIIERSWAHRPSSGPTARPKEVRIARPDEEERIYASLMLLAEENALAPVSEDRVRAMLQRCRGASAANGGMRDGVIGIIDAPDGEIAGMTGLVMGQVWYSAAWHCEDVWTYVNPAYRAGHSYAKSLIQFAKWWAEQLGMPLFIGVASSRRTIGKIRFYSREVPLVGASFLWKGS